jgi:hypothetical protein
LGADSKIAMNSDEVPFRRASAPPRLLGAARLGPRTHSGAARARLSVARYFAFARHHTPVRLARRGFYSHGLRLCEPRCVCGKRRDLRNAYCAAGRRIMRHPPRAARVPGRRQTALPARRQRSMAAPRLRLPVKMRRRLRLPSRKQPQIHLKAHYRTVSIALPTFAKISPISSSLAIRGGLNAMVSPVTRIMRPRSWNPFSMAA